MSLNIEKAFNLVNHLFLITGVEKYGFKEDLTKWIQILIQNQEFCVINGGTTTNYFKFEGGNLDKVIPSQHIYLNLVA